MPELAEVDYFRKQWNPALGHCIDNVILHPKSRVFRGVDTSRLIHALTGSTLETSHAHGKQMLFEFRGGHWLGLHLGMTGKLRLEPRGLPPQKHDRLILVQAKHACVFSDPRHFGRVRFDEGTEPPAWWRNLPPAVTSKDFTHDLLAAFFKRRAKTPLKAALLMQERFPGIGNWMADEILWRTKIHPSRSAGSLDTAETKLLWKNLRDISRQALRLIGTDWSDPPNTWLFNHRWKNDNHCPRCGTKLTRREIGGRTTCFCTKCQAA